MIWASTFPKETGAVFLLECDYVSEISLICSELIFRPSALFQQRKRRIAQMVDMYNKPAQSPASFSIAS